MVQVKSFYAHNDLRNFSYLIFDPTTANAWVIDPFDPEPIAQFIKKQGLGLRRIFNTHQHWDHIRGNPLLQSLFHCEVSSGILNEIEMSHQDQLKSLHTPGHTLDHEAFIWTSANGDLALFSGDTLFNSGVGNCRYGGDVDLLYETTLKLLQLPNETILYPGHDYIKKNLLFAQSCEPSNKFIQEALKEIEGLSTESNLGWTLKREKEVNPFFRLASEEIRQNFSNKSDSLENPNQFERQLFINLRAKRDSF